MISPSFRVTPGRRYDCAHTGYLRHLTRAAGCVEIAHAVVGEHGGRRVTLHSQFNWPIGVWYALATLGRRVGVNLISTPEARG
jgi:hypothetical protein